ncbi:MAG: hypothetical protein HOP08_18740 [Cyclobacteriaceae bacterium]|nr:hypothetical protein [Cyclobacteriaceae bacterium]
MTAEKRTIKIRAMMNTNLEFTDRARGKFSQKFIDFLVDTDESFRNELMIPINNEVGLFNWAIDFIENPAEGFLVDIYCDGLNDYHRILNIITGHFPDTEFLFYNKGPINTQVAA